MYSCVSAQQFVGVVLVVIARLSVIPLCSVQGTAAVPCGIMNAAGNKGGVTCSLTVLDTSVAFVAVHLAGKVAPALAPIAVFSLLHPSRSKPCRPPHR
jgi:hypothetical protein